MAKRLTEITVARAQPVPGRRLELTDGLVPGLMLRVGERTKAWTLLYRLHGRQRRLKIGSWPAVGLADARRLGKEALLKVAKGEDPDPGPDQARADTFAAVSAQFVERYARRHQPRTWRETEGMVRAKLLPVWSARPVRSIGRADVLDVLDREIDAGRERTANKLLNTIRKLFDWSAERGLIDANPAAGIKKPGRELTRDRVVEADELAAIWRATDGFGWPWQPFVRLLVVTAQRRDEVAGARWSEIDLERRTWTIPRERSKSDREHTVPLSDLALEIIEGLPRIGDLLFPANRAASTNPISGFSKVKRRLDQLSGVKNWRFHDLRRSAASGIARLGHPPHVVAAVLNHTPGSTMGITAVYNRHRYTDEKRAALEAWGCELDRMLGRVQALRGAA